jgi:hypothetical protein
MTTKKNEVRAFIIHDERGGIVGAAIPADPNARCGIRTPNHCVSEVAIPRFDNEEKLHAHIQHIVKGFRLEVATTDRPARLVLKPGKETAKRR